MKSYITELYACPARLLDEVMITPDGMAAFVPDYVRWTRIGLSGIARMEVTDSAENGVRRFTTTLQAVVDERPAPVREPQAFLAVGAEGRAYLVGSGCGRCRWLPCRTFTPTERANARRVRSP